MIIHPHTWEKSHFLIYAYDINKASIVQRSLTEDEAKLYDQEDEEGRFMWDNLRRRGGNSTPKDRPGQWYPLYVNIERKEIRLHPFAAAAEVWPIDPKGIKRIWRVSPSGFQREYDAGNISVIRKARRIELVKKSCLPEGRKPKTLWQDSTHSATSYGTRLLFEILGSNSFSYPKSLYFVRDCLSFWAKRDALILDFFSGSGTTFHATALLNAEDGGNRRCILVTNNEMQEKQAKELTNAGHFPGDPEFEKHGIAESVTWPRSKYVIDGRRDDGTELPGAYLNGRALKDGFEENMEYFKLDFLDPNAVSMGQAFEAILPILWMKAGCLGGRESSRGSKPWFIPKNSPYAVLIKEQEFPAFRKELKGRKDITHVFFVTDSEENFQTMSNSIGLNVETVQLYRSYLENFRINTKLPGLL